MKLDNVKTDIIIDLANEYKVPASDISKMLDGYYKSISNIIETSDKKPTIKMDYFGKLIFSDGLFNKGEIIAEKLKKRSNAINGI